MVTTFKFSRFIILIMVVLLILFQGCRSSVPKEVVELSGTLGESLESIHRSYRASVKAYFQALRDQVEFFMKTQWEPTFIKNFMKRAQLGKLAADTDRAKAASNTVGWTKAALEAINKKRRSLLDPIDENEKSILEMVDNDFALMIRANKKITAFLGSIKKVDEATDAVTSAALNKLHGNVKKGLEDAGGKAAKRLKDADNSNSGNK